MTCYATITNSSHFDPKYYLSNSSDNSSRRRVHQNGRKGWGFGGGVGKTAILIALYKYAAHGNRLSICDIGGMSDNLSLDIFYIVTSYIYTFKNN